MDGHSIVRYSTSLMLGAARLPLSAAEIVARHVDEPTWPPTLAFAGFEAKVRQVVGSLARDPALEAQGHLEESRLAKLRESLRLEAAAEERRAEAEDQFRRRRAGDEKLREKAADAADQADDQLSEAQERAEEGIDQAARRRQQAGREADERAAEKRRARARSSRQRAIEKERDAIGSARQAADADAAIERTDKQIRRSKSSR